MHTKVCGDGRGKSESGLLSSSLLNTINGSNCFLNSKFYYLHISAASQLVYLDSLLLLDLTEKTTCALFLEYFLPFCFIVIFILAKLILT